MKDDELSALKSRHKTLLKLCASTGANGKKTAVGNDKLKAARDTTEFLLLAVRNHDEISFVEKTFHLCEDIRAWVSAHAIPPDGSGDAQYVEELLAHLRQTIASIEDVALRQVGSDAIFKFATSFNGKLEHSSAATPQILACARPTSLPHASSRTVSEKDLPRLIDQAINDSSGTFQRVVRLLDPQSTPDWMPERVAATIRDGAYAAMREPQKPSNSVDPFLRQVLLPTNAMGTTPCLDYLAVGPLPFTGFFTLLFDVDKENRLAVDAQKERENAAKKKRETFDESPIDRLYVTHGALPVGGGNPQNTSLVGKGLLQRPYVFLCPEADQEVNTAYRLFLRGSRVSLAPAEVRAVVTHALRLREISKVPAHSRAAFRRDRSSEKEFSRIIERICTKLFRQRGLFEANEDLLSIWQDDQTRGPLDPLSKLVLAGDFGSKFRTTLAHDVARLALQSPEGTVLGQADANRLEQAIERVLCDSNARGTAGAHPPQPSQGE